MPDIFTKLFLESFETLSAKEADSDSFEGVSSVYTQATQNMLGLALDDLKSNEKVFANNIVSLYAKLDIPILLSSRSSLESFRKFSSLLAQALSINNVFSGDDIVRKKLADIITYVYGIINNNNYVIYQSFDTAKTVTAAIHKRLKIVGLLFTSYEFDDLLQKILLSVLYRKSHKD